MHWEGVWIVLGVDKQGKALLTGPVEDGEKARELASSLVKQDPQWRRAFPLEVPFGYDFNLNPDGPVDETADEQRRTTFPDLPRMVRSSRDVARMGVASRPGDSPGPRRRK